MTTLRKGEETRQEMLAVAERLFCTKGYEATSVQDILSVLHISKGGFYHHFNSKEEVLNTLCRMRAERAGERADGLLENVKAPMERLNILLHGFMPLRREELPFINMLLPLLRTPEGRTMGLCYQEALKDVFLPLLAREIASAQEQQIVCPPVIDVAGIILHLINSCWLDVALGLLEDAKKAQVHDTVALLSVLNRYRRSVEVLLDAPFGSVEILRIDEWDEVATRLSRTLMLPM